MHTTVCVAPSLLSPLSGSLSSERGGGRDRVDVRVKMRASARERVHRQVEEGQGEDTSSSLFEGKGTSLSSLRRRRGRGPIIVRMRVMARVMSCRRERAVGDPALRVDIISFYLPRSLHLL